VPSCLLKGCRSRRHFAVSNAQIALPKIKNERDVQAVEPVWINVSHRIRHAHYQARGTILSDLGTWSCQHSPARWLSYYSCREHASFTLIWSAPRITLQSTWSSFVEKPTLCVPAVGPSRKA
jgi:hypothetical protein